MTNEEIRIVGYERAQENDERRLQEEIGIGKRYAQKTSKRVKGDRHCWNGDCPLCHGQPSKPPLLYVCVQAVCESAKRVAANGGQENSIEPIGRS